MSTTSENNKRIAKNTMMLYIRQMITMVISLFTVRIVLQTLGAEDYGINNVVAGAVTMFGFLTGAMAISNQRFLSYNIGREDELGSLPHILRSLKHASLLLSQPPVITGG